MDRHTLAAKTMKNPGTRPWRQNQRGPRWITLTMDDFICTMGELAVLTGPIGEQVQVMPGKSDPTIALGVACHRDGPLSRASLSNLGWKPTDYWRCPATRSNFSKTCSYLSVTRLLWTRRRDAAAERTHPLAHEGREAISLAAALPA